MANDRGANDRGANDPGMKGRRNSWRRKLAADQRGSISVENSIVFGLLIVLTVALIEFSLALWQWNTAEKATELGVRYAVQSDPVALGLAEYNGVTGGGFVPGTSLKFSNLDAFTLSCTSSSCSCSGAGCGDFTGSVSNPTGVDTVAFNAIITRMDGIFRGSDLDTSNVTIVYSHVGMGFAGRQKVAGLDIVPVVTVRLTGVTFDFMVLNFLLPMMLGGSQQSSSNGIPMPPFTATLSGEDMYSGGTS